jgi:hypothetical protein
LVEFGQELISIPAFPRPVPEIGWVGVVAAAAYLTYVFAGLRSTILVTATLPFFGVVGLWPAARYLWFCGNTTVTLPAQLAASRRSASARRAVAAARCPTTVAGQGSQYGVPAASPAARSSCRRASSSRTERSRPMTVMSVVVFMVALASRVSGRHHRLVPTDTSERLLGPRHDRTTT